MAEVGYASLGIIPSFDGFQSKLERGTTPGLLSAGRSGGTRFGSVAGDTAGRRFGSVFSSAAKASILGLAGAGALAVAFGKSAVSSASDLAESTNKVQQVFGDAAGSVFKFTEGAADKLGQSNVAARDAASTFGIFAHAADLSDRRAAKFSKRMTILASDLASFHNTEPDEAVEALGAALRGEAEPIRKYGVLLDDATLKAEAMRLGLLKPVKDASKIKAAQVAVIDRQKAYNDAVAEYGPKSLEALKAEAALGTAHDTLKKATEGTLPALTQQQKILAAQSSIFKQTETAQGDFNRTSDGLANQQRRLAAEFENTKAKLGEGLLPIVSEAAGFLLEKGVPAFQEFSDWFTKKGVPAIKDFVDQAKPVVKDVLPKIVDTAGAMKDVAKDVGPVLLDVFEAFNKLPDWVKGSLALGAGAAVLKSKLSGGGLAGGLTATAANKLVPIRVFETNPLALGGGGGVGGGAGGGKGSWFTKATFAAAVIAAGSVAADDANGGKRSPQVAFANSGMQGNAGIAAPPGTTLDDFDNFGNIGATKAVNGSLRRSIDLIAWMGDVAEEVALRGGMFELQKSFDKLPKTLRTRLLIEGGPDSMREVKDLQRQFDLTPKEVKTLVKVYGVDEAKRQVEVALTPFMVGRTPAKESQGSDAMLPAPSDVPSRGRGSSRRGSHVTVNQHIGVVNDSKQLNKDAASKAQQAAMGGW